MDCNILFLGGLYPKEIQDEILSNSKKSIQLAANNFQWSIVQGLEENSRNYFVLTAPFISTFPWGYKHFYFKGGDYFYNDKTIKCISFINFPFLKNKKALLKREILKWYKNTTGKKCIIIYALIRDLMGAAIEVKKENPELLICQIVPDLPEFMGANYVYRVLGLKKRDNKKIYEYIKSIDAFVLLTHFMTEYLKVEEKPHTIVDGMFKAKTTPTIINPTNKKVVFYSGALARHYGIINLLNAFALISDENFELWICGGGDCKEEVQLRAKNDKRIKYFGVIPTRKVQIMQKTATVLVNPRLSQGVYTKFSFPSKIIEYFASGTPVIMYELDGILKEYYDYCIIPKNNTPLELKKTIENVCSMPSEERNSIGNKARDFIINNKSPKIQTEKIIRLIDGIDFFEN